MWARQKKAACLDSFAATRKPAAADEYAIPEFPAEFSDWKNKKTNSADIENSYLIGFGGSVFAVEHWLVEKVVTYEAIGAGMNFALAALHLGNGAKKAVETAIELSIYCDAPVKVIQRTA